MFDLATLPYPHSHEQRRAHAWVWPLPLLDGLVPGIVDRRPSHPERRDFVLGYEVAAALPRFVPVFAARDGAVRFAGTTTNGYSVALEHKGGWCTQYAGFEHMFAAPTCCRHRTQHLHAGDVLGYLSHDRPHVRFELATLSEEEGYLPIDPSQRMRHWALLPWSDVVREPSTSTPTTKRLLRKESR
jgi:hypothetical protein